MTFCRRLAVFVIPAMLFCAGGSLHAQTEDNRAVIEILSLQHRDPSQIRHQIQQQLDPRGHIGQIDNKLVIATTSANLRELKSLIDQIDVPPRRLVVSVDFDFNNSSPESQLSVQALEGEPLQIAQSELSANEVPAADPGTTSIDAEQEPDGIVDVNEPPATPSLWMQTDIRDNRAQLLVELQNVAGFSGRHPLTLELGVWMPLNQNETPADPVTDTEPAPEITPEATPVIAIRVDVLP